MVLAKVTSVNYLGCVYVCVGGAVFVFIAIFFKFCNSSAKLLVWSSVACFLAHTPGYISLAGWLKHRFTVLFIFLLVKYLPQILPGSQPREGTGGFLLQSIKVHVCLYSHLKCSHSATEMSFSFRSWQTTESLGGLRCSVLSTWPHTTPIKRFLRVGLSHSNVQYTGEPLSDPWHLGVISQLAAAGPTGAC